MITSLDSVEMIVEWQQFGVKVRSGEFPDACHIVKEYMELGEELAQRGTKRNKQWFYKRMLAQLEDTVCDSLVARHWREYCADNIYRPIHLLASIAETPREHSLVRRMSKTTYRQCHYFLSSCIR